MVPNVTVIYCLSEILLLLKNLDIHCLSESFIVWTAWDVNVFLICYLQVNYEYITIHYCNATGVIKMLHEPII